MGPFIMAWAIGEGIIVYRGVTKTKAPPIPGALLASSGLFALLAILAEWDRARPVAVALAYGFDIAAFMNLYPPVTGGGAATSSTAAAAAPASGG
jgi:hypothetical protein